MLCISQREFYRWIRKSCARRWLWPPRRRSSPLRAVCLRRNPSGGGHAAGDRRGLSHAGPRGPAIRPSSGYLPLREKLAQRLTGQGISCTAENILIVSGSQQGLDLAGKVFLEPGDLVVCENPTYLAALTVFRSYECGLLPIETDDDGMVPEDLERQLAAHPQSAVDVYHPLFPESHRPDMVAGTPEADSGNCPAVRAAHSGGQPLRRAALWRGRRSLP